MSFLKNILDFSSKDESHLKIKIFGFIKFSVLRKELAERKSSLHKTFLYYKKNNIDITTFPKANGALRDIQIAELSLLKELDYVCKKNNFDYWLDFGTLLGAVRHKGFIPWDDDVDVSMPREHYEQIIETFKKDSRNEKIQIEYYRHCNKTPNYIIRLHYEGYPICLDIFPYDFYGDTIQEEDRKKITEKIRSIRMPVTAKIEEEGLSLDELSYAVENMKSQILVNGFCKKNKNSSLVWGVDFAHIWSQWCWNYNTIYPLSEVDFEGIKFNAPNNCDEYLTQVFGNYMDYPKEFCCGHTAFKLSDKTISEIKELIKE